ncbi:MAG: OmpA family protein [Gammaproteobacteria bacterium]
MKTMQWLTLSAVLLGASMNAAAATPRENTGVFGGALVGAAAGGPVGLIVGAAIGGHYANRSERLVQGADDLAQLNHEFDLASAELERSLSELEQVENTLLERARVLADQNQRIDQLVEDQMLLSALRLRVRFATDDATITEDDHETLAILARYLAQHPETRVQLDGHADARGTFRYNDKLSVARAQAVGEALIQRDVAEQQVEIRGFGEREAAANAQHPDQLAAERRVEVELIQPDESAQRLSNVQD